MGAESGGLWRRFLLPSQGSWPLSWQRQIFKIVRVTCLSKLWFKNFSHAALAESGSSALREHTRGALPLEEVGRWTHPLGVSSELLAAKLR
jgi:hypothetical protein